MASSHSNSHTKLNGLNAYIVDAVRSPIGRSHPDKGAYRALRADELLAQLMSAVVAKSASQMAATEIDDIVIGCVGQHLEQGKNIARLAWLMAKQPDTVPGVTINRLCASSLQAMNFAACGLSAHQGDVYLAGGVEHMHHVPMIAALDYSQELLARYEFPFTQMGLTAEKLAAEFGISRKEQDEFSFASHKKAVEAQGAGVFVSEIINIALKDGQEIVSKDQLPRADIQMESLATLKTVFKENGTVTAGNSSPLADGASLALLASENAIAKYKFRPKVQIMGTAVVGLDPCRMGLGPVPAIEKLLKTTGLGLSDIGLFELNEAFAAQAIACQRSLNIPMEKLNIYGGAIALGHPLGCTGTRLIATLTNAMQRKQQEFGIAAMCIGHGQGIATLLRLC